MKLYPNDPTPEELERVRRYECKMQGHDFEVLTTWQILDPQKIICGRCGEAWEVADVAA